MNVVIFSGGSGSKNIQKAINLIHKDIHITNIINAYDDGKSTGEARKTMNVLGPSDIRKNQYMFYKLNNNDTSWDRFFTGRENFKKSEIDDIINEVFENISDTIKFKFKIYIYEYIEKAQKDEFEDFNIANMVYAVMFNKYGYEYTINYFKHLLNIEHDIILNSYDNVILNAFTSNLNYLKDEGSIVDFNNKNEKITDVFFVNDKNEKVDITPNPKVFQSIKNADLIIISTGTLWASIIPIFMTSGINESIKNNECTKLMFINNYQDKDMKGVDNEELINKAYRYIDLSEFNICVNKDAEKLMSKFIENEYLGIKFDYENLSYPNHNIYKLKDYILKKYFDNINTEWDLVIDFDETICSNINSKITKNNLQLLNYLKKYYSITIISGNSYKSIKNNMEICDELLNNIVIYADGGITRYFNNRICNNFNINRFYIDKIDLVIDILEKYDLYYYIEYRPSYEKCTCLSIKPIRNRELYKSLLEFEFKNKKIYNRIEMNGKTTLDILNVSAGKEIAFYSEFKNGKFDKNGKFLFLGDNIDNGNDRKIANLCNKKMKIRNIIDTNIFLRYLKENLIE